LGRDGRSLNGIKEPEACIEFDCLDGFSLKDRDILKQTILSLPRGEFKMSNYLGKYHMPR
jgi:hypothetical protein